jgi:hypothetical protein
MSEIDAEPRSRSATGAVIIAVIFLAVLGTGVGIVLGSQQKNNDNGDNVANDTTVSASPSPTVTVTQTTDPGNTDGGNNATRTNRPTNSKSYRPTAKDDCPQQTDEEAGTSLTVKLYIRTSSSEVWICEGGGRTVYQGHLNGRPFPSATSDHSLYIGSVRYEAGVYAATNGGTTYYVSPERLRREENGVERANEPVVERYPG